MDTLLKDIRYGVRSLIKRPGFTVVAIITLALGIGLNSSIFSVINAVLLRPLPYVEPDRLLTFRSNQSAPDLADIEGQSRAFSKFGGLVFTSLDYTAAGEPAQIRIGMVTGGFFQTLGVQPERGRFITADDDKTGAPYVVMLSHELWQTEFGGDEQIIGKTIPLSGNVYTIIGVMPAGFNTPREKTEAWVPVHVAHIRTPDARSKH
jgi:hypothetical protein